VPYLEDLPNKSNFCSNPSNANRKYRSVEFENLHALIAESSPPEAGKLYPPLALLEPKSVMIN